MPEPKPNTQDVSTPDVATMPSLKSKQEINIDERFEAVFKKFGLDKNKYSAAQFVMSGFGPTRLGSTLQKVRDKTGIDNFGRFDNTEQLVRFIEAVFIGLSSVEEDSINMQELRDMQTTAGASYMQQGEETALSVRSQPQSQLPPPVFIRQDIEALQKLVNENAKGRARLEQEADQNNVAILQQLIPIIPDNYKKGAKLESVAFFSEGGKEYFEFEINKQTIKIEIPPANTEIMGLIEKVEQFANAQLVLEMENNELTQQLQRLQQREDELQTVEQLPLSPQLQPQLEITQPKPEPRSTTAFMSQVLTPQPQPKQPETTISAVQGQEDAGGQQLAQSVGSVATSQKLMTLLAENNGSQPQQRQASVADITNTLAKKEEEKAKSMLQQILEKMRGYKDDLSTYGLQLKQEICSKVKALLDVKALEIQNSFAKRAGFISYQVLQDVLMGSDISKEQQIINFVTSREIGVLQQDQELSAAINKYKAVQALQKFVSEKQPIGFVEATNSKEKLHQLSEHIQYLDKSPGVGTRIKEMLVKILSFLKPTFKIKPKSPEAQQTAQKEMSMKQVKHETSDVLKDIHKKMARMAIAPYGSSAQSKPVVPSA